MGGFDFDTELADADGGGEATTSSSSSGLTVYFGERPDPPRGPAMHADVNPAAGAPTDRGPAMHQDPEYAPWQDLPEGGPKQVSLEEAQTMIYRDGVQKRFVDLLLRNGIIARGDYTWDDIEGWWQKAVTGAANAYKHGGKKVTPYEWLELWHGSGVAGGAAAEDRDQVQKDYTEVDDLDARAAAEDTYSQLMGRAPKGRESDAVREMLNAYAKAHPSITRSHTQKDGDVTRRTSGGMSAAGAQQIVEDGVKAKPGYAEYQSATTYFNALQQALGATADV